MPQTELFRIARQMKRANPSFNPIPASIEKKRPLGKWAGDSYLFERDFLKREAYEPGCNLGLLVSNDYVVIDVDAKPPAVMSRGNKYSENTGVDDFNNLVEQNEPLPDTIVVKTPSGGKHYYFALVGREGEETLKNWTACMKLNDTLIAVDIRKKGGYVMCPPSKKGVKRYQWETDYKTKMAPLPQWIFKNILSAMEKNKEHFKVQKYTCDPSANEAPKDEDVQMFKDSQYWQDCFEIKTVPDRNNFYIVTANGPYDCNICERQHVKNTNHPFLVRHKGILRFVCRSGKGFNAVIEPDYLKMWEEYYAPVKSLVENMDITNREVSNMLHSVLEGTVFPTVKPQNWMLFDPEAGIWREEFRNVILRPLVDMFAERAKELKKICSKLSVEKEDIWDLRSDIASSLAFSLSMVKKKDEHLSSLFELIRDSRKDELFNSKKHLVHCANGVYDLDKEEFRKAKPDDYSTMSTKINYIPYDEHPEDKKQFIQDFFNDIMLGRPELIKFLLKVLCSALKGDMKDQQFYMFHGKGANAKSLLVKLLKKALGNYAAPIPSAQVSKPTVNAQAASPSLVALENKRAAFLTEMEDKVMHTEFIKMVAGGDETSGRGLWKDQAPFNLLAKIFIAINDLPNIVDRTDGFWRKLVVIPFDAKFVDREPVLPNEKRIIDGYDEKLLKCADTFLALLIKIYITDYKSEGVLKSQHPAIVTKLGDRYRESQDVPAQFVKVRIQESNDNDDYVKTKDVERAFTDFCAGRGIHRNQNIVRHLYELMDAAYPPTNERRQVWVNNTNIRAWRGCLLKPEDEHVQQDEEPNYEEVDREMLRQRWAGDN